ncbi:hypothetical protein KY311_04455, partial [Candidatus Woesearchaeota archaeon]|nr:hypothetical protein [Candidatus Woesearchaeota archaeon]
MKISTLIVGLLLLTLLTASSVSAVKCCCKSNKETYDMPAGGCKKGEVTLDCLNDCQSNSCLLKCENQEASAFAPEFTTFGVGVAVVAAGG